MWYVYIYLPHFPIELKEIYSDFNFWLWRNSNVTNTNNDNNTITITKQSITYHRWWTAAPFIPGLDLLNCDQYRLMLASIGLVSVHTTYEFGYTESAFHHWNSTGYILLPSSCSAGTAREIRDKAALMLNHSRLAESHSLSCEFDRVPCGPVLLTLNILKAVLLTTTS